MNRIITLDEIINEFTEQSIRNQIEIKNTNIVFIIDEEIEALQYIEESFNGDKTIIYNNIEYKIKKYTVSFSVYYPLRLIEIELC